MESPHGCEIHFLINNRNRTQIQAWKLMKPRFVTRSTLNNNSSPKELKYFGIPWTTIPFVTELPSVIINRIWIIRILFGTQSSAFIAQSCAGN